MIERDSDGGPATQIVEHTYDYLNRWVARAVDSDGDGALGFEDTYFVYDGTPGDVSLDRAAVTTAQIGQIVLQFDDDAQGDPQLTHRYLRGPAVDQILADEQVTDLLVEGEVLWALTDHLGTVRDLAQHEPATSTTTIVNHRVFSAFGELISETDSSVDHLFGFTGRALDAATGLENNLNRWYDARTGRWLSQDPIGFRARDANIYRYVGNAPTRASDPTGLAEDSVERAKGTMADLADRLSEISESREAKLEAKRIGAAIKNTFEKNWRLRIPSITHDDRIKGYYCWDWAYAFENAFYAEASRSLGKGKYFNAKVEGASTPKGELHFWLRIESAETGECIYVDDGFWDLSYVHDERPCGGRYQYDSGCTVSDKPKSTARPMTTYDSSGESLAPRPITPRARADRDVLERSLHDYQNGVFH